MTTERKPWREGTMDFGNGEIEWIEKGAWRQLRTKVVDANREISSLLAALAAARRDLDFWKDRAGETSTAPDYITRKEMVTALRAYHSDLLADLLASKRFAPEEP